MMMRARMHRRHSARRSESGAALLTVLLMVMVMATVSVAVMDDILFAIRRTGNMAERTQMEWYVRGAEAFARQLLLETPREALQRAMAGESEDGNTATFDIEGGWIRAEVTDGGNCFNVNSVVTTVERGEYRADPAGRQRYRNLLAALDFNESEQAQLSGALVDWIDSDTRPVSNGAEDFKYADKPIPYRTGNTLMADISELRAVDGYDVETYATLRPYLCARPNTEPSVLNVNTLAPDRAALLSMLIGDALTRDAARQLIADRPEGGYANQEAFWAQEAFSGIEVPSETRAQAGLETRFYKLTAEVRYHSAASRLTTILERTGNRLSVVSRRLGDWT